jgi:SRSO17 transposase
VPTTHGDTIAQAVPGTTAQRWQEVRTPMDWDEEALTRPRVQQMIAEATTGDGGLGCDATGLPTRGTAAVGVARPSSGTVGNGGNGPMAVTCCASERRATGPVAVRVYLPTSWAADPGRRQPARVPPAVTFQTTPEMALALRAHARAWGVPQRGGVAEAADGDHPTCLAGLEARQERSVVAGRTDVAVRVGGAATSAVWRAAERLQRVPRWPWRTLRWRRGTHGWRRKKCVAVRGGRVTRDGPHHEGWRVGARATQGQPEERQYCWRNLPPDTSLDALAGDAHRRPASAPFHAEATGAWGWDQ